MTNEEIVEQLESIIGTYEILTGHGVNSDVLDDDDIEAVKKAIQIVKAVDDIKAEIQECQKHCEECGDYISENAYGYVLEIIDNHIGGQNEEMQQ